MSHGASANDINNERLGMRDIKFRVWDKDGHKMHLVRRINWREHWLENSLSKGFEVENIQYAYEQQDSNNKWMGNHALMQYTGLKDKNGVEIYEGDVIDTVHGRHLVVFHRSAFMCQATGNTLDFYTFGSIEVIGNIHENPKLKEDDNG